MKSQFDLDLEKATNLLNKVRELNFLLSEASRTGLTCELEVLEVTVNFQEVPFLNLDVYRSLAKGGMDVSIEQP